MIYLYYIRSLFYNLNNIYIYFCLLQNKWNMLIFNNICILYSQFVLKFAGWMLGHIQRHWPGIVPMSTVLILSTTLSHDYEVQVNPGIRCKISPSVYY